MDCKYDFICEYELKAHSPLIHFQAEQRGANLRATEVKPKLDKFLAEKARARGINIKKYIKSHNALNYKMTVEDSALSKNKIIYNVNQKTGSLYKGRHKAFQADTKIKIICFHEGLRKLIDEYIEEFFIVHNFGTRQNKGFGSYTVTKKNSEKCENKSCEEIETVLAKHYGSQNCYCFSVDSLSKAYQKIKELSLDRCPTLCFFKIIDNTVYSVAKKIKRVDYKSKK